MAAQQQSSFVTISRASLTFAAAISLARVFAGGAWFGAIVVAAVVPALIFAFAQRRDWHPLTAPAFATAIGAVLAITVDDPSETWAGIPTRAAIVQFGRDLGHAPSVL